MFLLVKNMQKTQSGRSIKGSGMQLFAKERFINKFNIVSTFALQKNSPYTHTINQG